jgi:hypothetical protein
MKFVVLTTRTIYSLHTVLFSKWLINRKKPTPQLWLVTKNMIIIQLTKKYSAHSAINADHDWTFSRATSTKLHTKAHAVYIH